MLNFIKVILFLIVVVGTGVYFFIQSPEIFKIPSFKGENILDKIFPKSFAPKTSFYAPSYPPSPSPSYSYSYSYSPTSLTEFALTISGEQTIPDYLIPSGLTREQLSPYFKKVKISSAYTSSWSTAPSQINLFSSLKGETINITGWKIKSNRREIIIPQAVNIYEPSGFSPQEDIIVSENNSINIYSNKSSLNRNLRLNKCIGYLEENYDFNPSLPQNCPSIPRSEITYLSGECQSYILSLWGCKLPEVSFYNTLLGSDEGNACRAFLNTISHGSCFQKYRYGFDFLSNEWRIWIDQDILDPQHDRIRLFDKNGLLVDEYIY